MAKRTRGSRRDRRRGGRPTTVAPVTRAPEGPVGSDDVARDDVLLATPAPAALQGGATRSSSAVRPSSRLSAAAGEYRYVGLDLRRIAAVIGTLLTAMLALWVAMDVLRVISL